MVRLWTMAPRGIAWMHRMRLKVQGRIMPCKLEIAVVAGTSSGHKPPKIFVDGRHGNDEFSCGGDG
jgi:hypothetical protein